jgi:hypothetical protein
MKTGMVPNTAIRFTIRKKENDPEYTSQYHSEQAPPRCSCSLSTSLNLVKLRFQLPEHKTSFLMIPQMTRRSFIACRQFPTRGYLSVMRPKMEYNLKYQLNILLYFFECEFGKGGRLGN